MTFWKRNQGLTFLSLNLFQLHFSSTTWIEMERSPGMRCYRSEEHKSKRCVECRVGGVMEGLWWMGWVIMEGVQMIRGCMGNGVEHIWV